MKRFALLVAGVLVLLASVAEARAATRIALVVGPGGNNVRSAIDLATAKLSAEKGIDLLERAGIDRVLAEQKLTLAGLADAGQAIKAGKLLSADLLAVVEVTPDGKSALGLVVFDSKTGLRLWDEALPEGGPDKGADGIAEGVRAALKKRAAGRDGLHTVGFVAVRNADLPRPMDSFCEALGLLVERRLVASPSVGVLERQRLEAVTGERALPTGAEEKELLGALVQLDLEVRRGVRGEGMQATVLLSDGKGKHLGKFTAPVKEADPKGAADALARRICEALKATPAAREGNPAREGSRFLTEARQLWSFKQYPRALRTAESAHALAPADPASRALLSQYLIARGGDLLSPIRPFGSHHRLTAEAEVVATSAGLVRRGLDLRSLALSSRPKTGAALDAGVTADTLVELELTITLSKFAALEDRRQSPEAKRHAAEFLAAAERWLCEQYLETLAGAAESDSGAFDVYSSQLPLRVAQLRLATPDAQHFTRKVIALTERWLAVAARQKIPQVGTPCPWQMFTQTTETARHSIRWSPGPRELALFEGLFDKMEKHPYPLVRFQGRCGHLWVGRLNKKLSPDDCYKGYLAAKRELLAALQNPRRQMTESEFAGYANLAMYLTRENLLPFQEVKKRTEEIFDSYELLLSRNVVTFSLIHEALYQPLSPEPLPGRKLDLMDRTLTALDSPRVNYYGGDPNAMKGELALHRARFVAAHPELAAKQAPTPWESLRTVLDSADLPGIRELKFPTLFGEEIFVTGIGSERGKEFIQPFRVPLNGKRVEPLAKVFLTWRPVPRNPGSFIIPSKITGCQIGIRHLYVATRTEGLYAFPLDGRAARRIDETNKLPSEAVECLALYEGHLYAALDGGYLVSVDPESGKFDVLASSRRREKVSPFDDGKAFMVTSMVADPLRHRLLFVLLEGRTRAGSLNGLWAFSPKEKAFKHLLETNGVEYPMVGRMSGDNRLFLASMVKAVEVDLTRDKYTLLYAWGDPQTKVLDQKTALCQEFFRGHPALYLDGWMWMTTPLSRVSLTAKKQEAGPNPQRKGNAPSGSAEALVPVGKDRLLYGSSTALWLITLRKEK